MEGLVGHAPLIQTLALLLAYLAVLLWEKLRPLLRYGADDRQRWTSNFGLLFINHGLPYLLVPVVAAVSAWAAPAFGLGLLRNVGVPAWLMLVVAVLALDLSGWILHWSMHKLGPLWRIHRVHHSDLQFDSSLGFRFHPAEVALVALVNAVVVVVLGLPLEAVLLSAVITNVHNFFGHANARLDPGAESGLRRIVITPDLHRLHHSACVADYMSNFGIVFSWWDRLAGTYRAPVGSGPREFGLDVERDPRRLSLARLLAMPLQRTP
jgi:sterol desaturase/sphingolipid hydroxylase (fatty acid hydroxylase superfamily)